MKLKASLLFFLIVSMTASAQVLVAQKQKFTKQDTLRGSITPERAWWDVNFYHLALEVEPDKKFISGTNAIRYTVLSEHNTLQIDLQAPLKIEKATQDGENLAITSDVNAHFISLNKPQIIGESNEVIVYYSGVPKEAVRAPWDGGFSWKKDENGKHFIATSCQGLGASVWWPNKDHMYDEVDSMAISVTVPKGLMNVSNGRLRSTDENETTSTFHWAVENPINNYGVNVNIGDYVHFGEKYEGEKGTLDMDYYVLKDHLDVAKKHFKDAPKMMKAFEHWFGPYPFYEDSFKLVEVPYLGMEHQSSVTYGNKYMKGYLGEDLSGTGWGMKFDFIIIHEAGHEWFANNITYKDIADMWIHESFTAYSENLFLDFYYGKEASADYVIGTRKKIKNDTPIIGPYNVNTEGSRDMYYKGANMLHTIRQLVYDDEKWRSILRGLNQEFYHQTVTTAQIENYMSNQSGLDLSKVFDQYLRSTTIPVLEYKIVGKKLSYRYTDVVEGFKMPLKVRVGKKELDLTPTENWTSQNLNGDLSSFEVPRDYYILMRKL
ncbi:M1 family metallopeptidase [Cellulophaga sp. Hel_I_12]|uniref:M1 family metallopeptidase n=1 Tax=Cellulophaga sp. Hel_I_12 TaxID=1249972 RepID=UPI00064645DD|nr:M1 family metallopeptidase [Cellulophaga sp. Hel_I_12]